MKEITQARLTGERALFASRDMKIVDCLFEDGESPLKESEDIALSGCMFRWKYPLWYCRRVSVKDSAWFEMARAGVWYSQDVSVTGAVIQAPKNFRRCRDLKMKDVTFTNAEETLWACRNVEMEDVTAKGDYFAMNCEDMKVRRLILDGNYAFDGVKNAEVREARMLSKDAFWNSENVTVYDSFISGEYLGWNAKGLTLVNCTVESLQGMCYIEDLRMVNCKLINTTLAFERSSVEAEINSRIGSVFDPESGSIKAQEIGELIVEKDRVDPDKTRIRCCRVEKRSDRPEWMRG